MPVTVDVVYSGANQVINGMSNPNSEIYIDINGKEVTTRTDENGKFSYVIEGSVSKEDVIKIASKEDGKEKSIYKISNYI